MSRRTHVRFGGLGCGWNEAGVRSQGAERDPLGEQNKKSELFALFPSPRRLKLDHCNVKERG